MAPRPVCLMRNYYEIELRIAAIKINRFLLLQRVLIWKDNWFCSMLILCLIWCDYLSLSRAYWCNIRLDFIEYLCID